ncbi:hypothetical protein ACWDFR_18630 [Streptomyces sp. 900105755]
MLLAFRPVCWHPATMGYRPAAEALNVAGDGYDLIDLLAATASPSMSACTGPAPWHNCAAPSFAASFVAESPARALEALGLYAHHRLGYPHHHLQQRRPPHRNS